MLTVQRPIKKIPLWFYDDNNAMLKKPMIISIKLTEPITAAALGIPPFNPFLIIHKNREKEIHLPFARATSLASKEILVAATNQDVDSNYVTEQGLPWAINIVHDFKVPKEKISINKAYNFIVAWAIFGGKSNAD